MRSRLARLRKRLNNGCIGALSALVIVIIICAAIAFAYLYVVLYQYVASTNANETVSFIIFMGALIAVCGFIIGMLWEK